jgi:lipoate-protein ligase A
LPFVRRPSGGMTLIHHHELTYALALPAGPPWQVARQKPWLCRMHDIIAAALLRWGVTADAATCEIAPAAAGPLCFQHITPGDLLLCGSKIVGSAQRRQRGALLQHGGILLQASTAAPALPGILELANVQVPMIELADEIARAWKRDTGWTQVSAEWSDAERIRIEDLVQSKYASDAWNCKR